MYFYLLVLGSISVHPAKEVCHVNAGGKSTSKVRLSALQCGAGFESAGKLLESAPAPCLGYSPLGSSSAQRCPPSSACDSHPPQLGSAKGNLASASGKARNTRPPGVLGSWEWVSKTGGAHKQKEDLCRICAMFPRGGRETREESLAVGAVNDGFSGFISWALILVFLCPIYL